MEEETEDGFLLRVARPLGNTGRLSRCTVMEIDGRGRWSHVLTAESGWNVLGEVGFDLDEWELEFPVLFRGGAGRFPSNQASVTAIAGSRTTAPPAFSGILSGGPSPRASSVSDRTMRSVRHVRGHSAERVAGVAADQPPLTEPVTIWALREAIVVLGTVLITTSCILR